LILQASVTQPWTDARYVPAVFRDAYVTAFKQFGWAGDVAAMVVFGLMVKFRESVFEDEDKVRALVGSRLDEARRDPAFAAIASTILREHPGNARGELSDARSIFFSRSPYCRWEDVRVPALVVHDREDTFVPFVHAEEAAERLPRGDSAPSGSGGTYYGRAPKRAPCIGVAWNSYAAPTEPQGAAQGRANCVKSRPRRGSFSSANGQDADD
jgi:pimeloyl-ACP methyl ester carboxylesterase